MIKDIVVSFFIISGSIFTLLASLGVLRFPDLFSRMHAATKSASFGVVLIMVGVSVYFCESWVIFESVMLIAFIFITSPVAYQMIGRAAYFLKIPMWEGTVVDELRERYDLDKHLVKSGLELPSSLPERKK